jgi:hypothetical protein
MDLDMLDRMIDASKQAHNEYTKSDIDLVSVFGDSKSATLITNHSDETATITIKLNGGIDND